MIPAHPEPELSAKTPALKKPEGFLVTNECFIMKSDNIGAVALEIREQLEFRVYSEKNASFKIRVIQSEPIILRLVL